MTFSNFYRSLLLLGAQLVLSGWVLTTPNEFFYHNYLKGNGSKESMIYKTTNLLTALFTRSIVHISHSSFQWLEALCGLLCRLIVGHVWRAQRHHTLQVLV